MRLTPAADDLACMYLKSMGHTRADRRARTPPHQLCGGQSLASSATGRNLVATAVFA